MNALTFLFIVSFILSFIFIAASRFLVLKCNICKKDKGVPFTGGVCLALAFAVPYFIYTASHKIILSYELIVLLCFSFVILFIEFLDDIKNFSLKARLIIQLVFIISFLSFGKAIQIYFLPAWLNYIFSFLWIMGITNAFNLLDIEDGICGGVSLIVCLSFLAVSVLRHDTVLFPLFISICGAVFAFLLFNFPPSKVFMGNSGSHFLGFFFAVISMYQDYATLTNPSAIILPILILGFPIIDTLFLAIARIKKGISPLRKSKDHIFLRLTSSGYPARRALLIIYLTSILWSLSGLHIFFGFNFYFLVTILFTVAFTVRVVYKAGSIH